MEISLFHCDGAGNPERGRGWTEEREAREAWEQRAVLVRVSPGCHDCGDFYKHLLSTVIFIVSLCNESAKTATQMIQKS